MRNSRRTNASYTNIFVTSMRFVISISSALIIIICVYYGVRLTARSIEQTISANRSVEETVANALRVQHETFKAFQTNLYLYKVDENQSIGQYIEGYLNALEMNSFDTITRKQEERLKITDYIESIGGIIGNDSLMILITGKTFSLDMPYTVLASTNSGEYARQVYEYVTAFTHERHASRRSTKLVPSMTSAGVRSTYTSYMIFDEFRSYKSPAQALGKLIMSFKTSSLDRLISSYTPKITGRLYVLNSVGEIVYDSLHQQTGGLYQAFGALTAADDAKALTAGRQTDYIYNESFGYYVVSTFELKEFLPALFQEYLVIIVMALVALALLTVLFYSFFRKRLHKITRLLDNLSDAMQNSDRRVEVDQDDDEIDAICIKTNKMLDTIQNSLREKYKQELENRTVQLQKREAELYALQAQIDPHFLYNALEIIRMRQIMKNDLEGADSIKLLGIIMRNRIKGESVRFLSSELTLCQNIVDLYSVNYGAEIVLDIDVQDQYMSCAVLQDTLAPLIENILTHNKNPFALRIEIVFNEIGSASELCVRDNGRGFSESILLHINELLKNGQRMKGESIGLVNLHRRLRLTYGEGFGLTIGNNERGGAFVCARIKRMKTDELNALLSTNNT